MNEDIVKAYEALRKKHGLPDFNSINYDFELSTIENPDFLLREIKNKIGEKIEFITSILLPVLQPDVNSFNDLQECRVFSENEKKDLLAFYSRLMAIHRASLMISILNDDKLAADFVNETFKKWPELKKQAAGYVKRLREIWEREFVSDAELGYLG